MSRHADRQKLAMQYGATDIVTEHGDEGCRPDQGPYQRARRAFVHRGGGHPGVDDAGHPRHAPRVGTSATSASPTACNCRRGAVLLPRTPAGGPAPVRRFLPEPIDLVWNRTIDPGKVFDLTLPLDEAAEGYRAMDERRAVKALLRP